MAKNFVSADEIRAKFSRAMSEMYRLEVPAYADLLKLVTLVNESIIENSPDIKKELISTNGLNRINEERHGAIRLGTAQELKTISRIFRVMGMEAVGYYDLTEANVPVHSTAFRSTNAKSLSHSPFRVFTSLLRTELIKNEDLRKRSEEILNSRNIFTPKLIELLIIAENDGGLNEIDTENFIREVTYTFKWHKDAATNKSFYEALKNEDPRAADIVCFKGPHINHLTPRTLDIDEIQKLMPQYGMNPKNVIEGPPRSCPVLLRQTSFKALTEQVFFEGKEGFHTARFGEIEQRSSALTKKGRILYDTLLNEVRDKIIPTADGSNANEYMEVLEKVFSKFPVDKHEMRKENLAYFQYYRTKKGENLDLSKIRPHSPSNSSLDSILDLAIEEELIDFSPVIYEDFLPVSAAGIFASNASDKNRVDNFTSSSKTKFEEALGHKVLDEFSLYEKMEEESIKNLNL